MCERPYVGGELEVFAQARCWKRYWISRLRPFVRGAVLEVGAGIGSNTLLLCTGVEERWLCLEPDPKLAATLRSRLAESAPAPAPEVRVGALEALAAEEQFGTVLYVDVLEHILDDRGELARAARHLRPAGHLLVLAPAHPWLFSPFDQAIGHFRRYTRGDLLRLSPPGLRVVRSFYLDSVGLLASLANRLLLRQAHPSASQIAFWDSYLVPCSKILDRLVLGRLGKSTVCVWQRKA